MKNEGTVVTALLSREEARAFESAWVVKESFAGSLPIFLASFLGGGRKLTEAEAEELKRLIDEHREN